MLDFEADLSLLFQDAGVPVVIGDTTTTGIPREELAQPFEGRPGILGRQRSVLCPAPELPTLHVDDELTVDGDAWKVRCWGPDPEHRDGLLTRIWLYS